MAPERAGAVMTPRPITGPMTEQNVRLERRCRASSPEQFLPADSPTPSPAVEPLSAASVLTLFRRHCPSLYAP